MQDARQKPGPRGAALRGPPPLHCIQAFEAVARHLSLAKAAGELSLSGAALAQSIAALEGRLGVKLVCGLSPRVELTQAGERYFHAVQAFANQLRDGLYERFPVGRARLQVTASQALARLWLAPRLGQFARRHPRIDVVLTSTAQLQSLKAGGVDVGLRYGGSIDEDLLAVPLWTDRHIAAGSPALAARAAGLSPAALARSLPLVEHPVASWRHWLGAIDPALASVDPLLTCNDLHLAIEAACQSLGLVIAPSRLLAGKIADGQLCRVSAHATEGKAYQAVLWRERAGRPALRAFLGWLEEQAAG